MPAHRFKQFVLLSGGLDSTTVLFHAIRNWPEASMPQDRRELVEAVSIDYGQRHGKELQHANNLCRSLGIQHTILPLSGVLGGQMLTDGGQEIPNASYAELAEGISPTYVPFRNGLMISTLAAHAQAWVMKQDSEAPERYRRATIYIGAHADDAARDAYPDCSVPFLQSMAKAVDIGTYHQVNLESPLAGKSKAEVVKMGALLGVPFEATWSCYKGEDLHCGTCPTCRSRKEAFEVAGILDPTQYAIG